MVAVGRPPEAKASAAVALVRAHRRLDQLDAARPSTHPYSSSAVPVPVHPSDKRGVLILKECGHVRTQRRGGDDNKTLSQCGFHPGDFLDVAVLSPPTANAPAATASLTSM